MYGFCSRNALYSGSFSFRMLLFRIKSQLAVAYKSAVCKKKHFTLFFVYRRWREGGSWLFANCDTETKREDPEALNYWEDLNWSEELIWKNWFERGDFRPLLVPCILIFRQFDHLQQIRQEFICSRTVPLSSSPSMRFAL